MSDGLVSQKKLDSKFLITLFRRFSERIESLVRAVLEMPFIKAVKKVFQIKQAKYLRFAIKYFSKPFLRPQIDYGKSLERVSRFIFHLKDVGIKKLIDGKCLYVSLLDGQYGIRVASPEKAYANHDRSFKVTVELVQQLTMIIGEKIEVFDYFRSIGLPGGGKVAHVKKYIAHEGVRRGTSSDYNIPIVRSMSFYSEDRACYERHHAFYGCSKPIFCTLKVIAQSMSENNGMVLLSLYDPVYKREELLNSFHFNKTRYYHTFKINLKDKSLEDLCRLEIHLHFDEFYGASMVVPYFDIFFF